MQIVILSHFIFPTSLGKTLKTLNKIKEEPCNIQKKYENLDSK